MAKEDEDGQAKFDDDSHMLADGYSFLIVVFFFFERCKTCALSCCWRVVGELVTHFFFFFLLLELT